MVFYIISGICKNECSLEKVISKPSSRQLLAYSEIFYNFHIKYDFMQSVCIAI